MSRSDYGEDIEDLWQWIMWRGAVASAIRGKRGQSFFVDLLTALDAMPNKRLIADELESNGDYCVLGALGKSRGMKMSEIDPYNAEQVSGQFNIAEALSREVVFMNDEAGLYVEAPENRWTRMRKWVADQIKGD